MRQPAAELAGEYLADCTVAASSVESNDPNIAGKVLALSEDWINAAEPVPEWP